MNEAVLRGLEVGDHVAPGRIRTANVSVGRYRCPDWQDAGYLLARLCETLDGFDPPDGDRHAFAILKAIFAHVYLAWIHPFGDGNGRTARLVELAVLLEAGLPLPACHLPSNHYNPDADRVLPATRARQPGEGRRLRFRELCDRGAGRRASRADRGHPAASMGCGLGQFRPRAVPRSRQRDRAAAARRGAGAVAGSRRGSGSPSCRT